jgi:D-glucuronyl C5-epimerase C-terminus
MSADGARATPVLVMGKHGDVRIHRHSLAPASTFPPVSRSRAARPVAAAAARHTRTVPRELARLLASGQIDQPTYDERLAAYQDAKRTVRRLKGTRKVQLSAVISTLDGIAARGRLAPSRLAPLWLTLERNREWWSAGPLLAPGRRVGFAGSQLVWQYYPGQGIQIQVLGTFGKVNALWSAKRNDELAAAVDELLPLAAERAGGLAWEYYFPYRAGRAPWVSSLAQGTALQALGRAAVRLHRRDQVWPITSRALTIFEQPAPEGVRVAAAGGPHYAQYSFEPKLRILNGFIQSLIGIYDYGRLANDDRARALFAAGDVRAQREVPTYDTGAWSLYSRGSVTHESDLGYHKLLRDFLRRLCNRTAEDVYCTAEEHFTDYLGTPPEIEVRTEKLRGGRYGRIALDLSKLSGVTLQIQRGSQLVHARYVGALSYGHHTLGWQVPRKPGEYTVELTARDLAGNPTTTTSTVEVLPPRQDKKGS